MLAEGVEELVIRQLDSPLGPLVAAAAPDGICQLAFADQPGLNRQRRDLQRGLNPATISDPDAHLDQLAAELADYFTCRRRTFSVPLVYPGTPFQRRVWARVLSVGYGQSISYEALARALGDTDAARAVGRANGQNRLALLIPCHRVVRKDGALAGYAGGLWRKRALRALEQGRSDFAAVERR